MDEAPEVVAPLLEAYRRVVEDGESPAALWRYVATVPDSNGRCHGVTGGSLQPRAEIPVPLMKPTAH